MINLNILRELIDELTHTKGQIEFEDGDTMDFADLKKSIELSINFLTQLMSVDGQLEAMRFDIEFIKKTYTPNTVKNTPTEFTPIVAGILSRVDMLKNLIKKVDGTDDDLFSPNLIIVETIELEIKEANAVTKKQLEQMNEMYKKYNRV